MRLKIWRSGKDGRDGQYQIYEISLGPGMTILDALFKVQDAYDDSLSFRYACRGAICGSCAMMVNREMRLACRTQLSGVSKLKPLGIKSFPGIEKPVNFDRNNEVLIEPLPNLPIIKDLVVDMTRFHEAYRKVRPWMESVEPSAGFSSMSQVEHTRIERYGNCILCACCFGSCPVCQKNPSYIGPHALAWAYRFIGDARVVDKDSRVELASKDWGAEGCEFVYNCVKACPKDVAPAGAIRKIKDLAGTQTDL